MRQGQAHEAGVGVPLTRIGVCTADGAVVLRAAGAADRPVPGGYAHFR